MVERKRVLCLIPSIIIKAKAVECDHFGCGAIHHPPVYNKLI